MPINKLSPSSRGKAALAGAVSAAALAITALITPWEGTKLVAYRDMAGIPTACTGETHGIRMGMRFTAEQCRIMLDRRVEEDFHKPLAGCVKGFDSLPLSLQAAMISGAYNFGVNAACGSTAAELVRQGRYREACEAQTAFNKVHGKTVTGLVNRREMGDAHRIGEAELCLSGLGDAP